MGLCSIDAADLHPVRFSSLRVLAVRMLIFLRHRSVYRSVELLNGWEGPIIKMQTLFDILDGMLMCLAVWIFNIVHPGFFLPRHERLVHDAA